MKKKYTISSEDKKNWIDYANRMDDIQPKEVDLLKEKIEFNEIKKLDLHGVTLLKANKLVEKFIIDSFNNGFKKLLIITGKGLRSKSYNNPYISEKLSVLKHAIPEYIKNDQNLSSKIISISAADKKHGGDGAIYISLKRNKDFKE